MSAAVIGSFSATGLSAWFAPLSGRGFNVSIWGTFTGTVQLVRSFDNGVTLLPVTANGTQLMKFTAPCSEQWGDDGDGVKYALQCTSLASGSAAYQISQ